MTDYAVTYAQNREDIILKGFFKNVERGFYVDVGANHPRLDSVTKLFYDQGWRGINIEPNHALHELLLSDRPEDVNLQIGISDKSGKLTLREYPEGHGLSTFSKTMQDDYVKKKNFFTQKYRDYEVEVRPLKEVLAEYGSSTINFMKVDVEGYEYEALISNDWLKFRPQMLCIESNHIEKDWRPLLEESGYKLVFFDGLNDYYLAKECAQIAENFSYPEALLAKPAIPEKFLNKTSILEWQLKQAEQKLVYQETLAEGLKADLHTAHVLQAQRRGVRYSVKQLLLALDAAISTQIKKLDKPKVNRQQEALNLLASEKAGSALIKVRTYDMIRYYNAATKKPMVYRVVAGVYAGFHALAKAGFRGLARIMRKARHG